MNVPRIILICCEGLKTEPQYFEFISKLYKVSAIKIKILSKKGQDFSLVDACVRERKSLANEYEVDLDDIETWAVCDDDNKIDYTELANYAKAKNIEIAFSRPCFEAYLLQHFEQSNEKDKKSLYNLLSKKADQPYAKGNITWLTNILDNEPKLVDSAILNSNQRQKKLKSPFLTVQRLTERIRDLEPR
jgi:hypothetical protein